jgi:hypothetical protein
VVDRGELLDRMAATPAQARALAMRRTTATDAGQGWSPEIVLGHLAYVDANVWLPRLREMAERDVPEWEWWEPDGVDWSGLYGNRDRDDVADELDVARHATLTYLAQLPGAGWGRRARHTVFGEIAVAGLCEQLLAHDDEHLAQLRRS